MNTYTTAFNHCICGLHLKEWANVYTVSLIKKMISSNYEGADFTVLEAWLIE